MKIAIDCDLFIIIKIFEIKEINYCDLLINFIQQFQYYYYYYDCAFN